MKKRKKEKKKERKKREEEERKKKKKKKVNLLCGTWESRDKRWLKNMLRSTLSWSWIAKERKDDKRKEKEKEKKERKNENTLQKQDTILIRNERSLQSLNPKLP
jgi:pre-mRNA-processing factor 40